MCTCVRACERASLWFVVFTAVSQAVFLYPSERVWGFLIPSFTCSALLSLLSLLTHSSRCSSSFFSPYVSSSVLTHDNIERASHDFPVGLSWFLQEEVKSCRQVSAAGAHSPAEQQEAPG